MSVMIGSVFVAKAAWNEDKAISVSRQSNKARPLRLHLSPAPLAAACIQVQAAGARLETLPNSPLPVSKHELQTQSPPSVILPQVPPQYPPEVMEAFKSRGKLQS